MRKIERKLNLAEYHNPQQEGGGGGDRRMLLVFAVTFAVIIIAQLFLFKNHPARLNRNRILRQPRRAHARQSVGPTALPASKAPGKSRKNGRQSRRRLRSLRNPLLQKSKLSSRTAFTASFSPIAEHRPSRGF